MGNVCVAREDAPEEDRRAFDAYKRLHTEVCATLSNNGRLHEECAQSFRTACSDMCRETLTKRLLKDMAFHFIRRLQCDNNERMVNSILQYLDEMCPGETPIYQDKFTEFTRFVLTQIEQELRAKLNRLNRKNDGQLGDVDPPMVSSAPGAAVPPTLEVTRMESAGSAPGGRPLPGGASMLQMPPQAPAPLVYAGAPPQATPSASASGAGYQEQPRYGHGTAVAPSHTSQLAGMEGYYASPQQLQQEQSPAYNPQKLQQPQLVQRPPEQPEQPAQPVYAAAPPAEEIQAQARHDEQALAHAQAQARQNEKALAQARQDEQAQAQSELAPQKSIDVDDYENQQLEAMKNQILAGTLRVQVFNQHLQPEMKRLALHARMQLIAIFGTDGRAMASFEIKNLQCVTRGIAKTIMDPPPPKERSSALRFRDRFLCVLFEEEVTCDYALKAFSHLCGVPILDADDVSADVPR